MIYNILYVLLIYCLFGVMVSIILAHSIVVGLHAAHAENNFQKIMLVIIFILIWPYMLIKTISRLFKK